MQTRNSEEQVSHLAPRRKALPHGTIRPTEQSRAINSSPGRVVESTNTEPQVRISFLDLPTGIFVKLLDWFEITDVLNLRRVSLADLSSSADSETQPFRYVRGYKARLNCTQLGPYLQLIMLLGTIFPGRHGRFRSQRCPQQLSNTLRYELLEWRGFGMVAIGKRTEGSLDSSSVHESQSPGSA